MQTTIRLRNAGVTHASRGKAPSAAQSAHTQAKNTEEAKQAYIKATRVMKSHYNKHRTPKKYMIGELVMLAARNIRTRRALKKLTDRYLSSFKILKRLGQNAYKLKLL